MRKFLLLLLVVLTMPAFAQDDYQYRISSFMSNDGFISNNYQYSGTTGTDIRGVHRIDLAQQMELIDSLVYDNEGRIISVQTHQLFEYGWRKVCWIDYTYNEMGLRATRTNYNDFGDGEGGILGGIYYYTYDEDGKLLQRDLEFNNYMFELIQYHYNEKGLLEAELTMIDAFTGTYENSILKEYAYDDNNNLLTTMVYTWSYDWYIQMCLAQEYDEYGNCTLAQTFSPEGLTLEKRVYEYDMSVTNDKVYHFIDPEDGFPSLPQMYHKLDSYEHWSVNQNTGELVYLRDYLFIYDEIGDNVAENNYSFNAQIYPNPTQDYITIESEDVEHVEILDVCGRVLYSSEVHNTLTIDMNDYEAGIYFVRLHSKGSTSVQKVVKK